MDEKKKLTSAGDESDLALEGSRSQAERAWDLVEATRLVSGSKTRHFGGCCGLWRGSVRC